jgi:hypothetical protein
LFERVDSRLNPQLGLPRMLRSGGAKIEIADRGDIDLRASAPSTALPRRRRHHIKLRQWFITLGHPNFARNLQN